MEEKYRIGIVGGCLSSHGGGMPRSMAQQARILNEHGYNVTLFAGYNNMYPFTPEELEIDKIPAYISKLLGPNLYGFPPKALFALWKHAKEFDAVHLNGAWNLTTFIASFICWLKHTPYIISCRSHYGDYHFSRMPLLKSILFQTLERFNIKHAYALHVTADWEKETSWRAVNLAKQIIKIPNPVNLSDFASPPSRHKSRETLGLSHEGYYIVHLGRLGKQKNLSFLVNAFHKAQLGGNAYLVLIGPPEKEEKRRIKQLAEKLNIEHRLDFIDFAKGRERCDWMSAADLFALPSHDDNFCISAIEAVASGTHCLLSPNIGATEFLPQDYVTVKPVDINEWSTWLNKNYTSPHKQQIPNHNLFIQFDEKHIENDWKQVYQEIMKSRCCTHTTGHL